MRENSDDVHLHGVASGSKVACLYKAGFGSTQPTASMLRTKDVPIEPARREAESGFSQPAIARFCLEESRLIAAGQTIDTRSSIMPSTTASATDQEPTNPTYDTVSAVRCDPRIQRASTLRLRESTALGRKATACHGNDQHLKWSPKSAVPCRGVPRPARSDRASDGSPESMVPVG